MLNRTALAATAAALLLIFSQSAQVTNAQSTPSADSSTMTTPIKIENISVEHTAGKFPRYFYGIAFRVESTVAADEVHFVVRDGAHETPLVDKGKFSPGVMIAHNFITSPGSSPNRDSAAGTVTYAHFVDGSHWDANERHQSKARGRTD